jgi:hypothetical protein
MFGAGYAARNITPPLGIDLTGFGFYLNRRAESVLDDLKIRALCLKNSAQSVFLITCDLLGFTVAFSDGIRKSVAASEKIPESNILLACTHTHSGPATQPIPGVGRLDAAYLGRVAGSIVEAAAEARASVEEAKFGFHFEAAEPIGYNRRLGNFVGIDPWLKVAVFKQRKKTVFLLSYACHPVILGPTTQISADWPGALIREIEARGCHGLFFQGFCGDIDPVTYLNRRLGAGQEDLSLYGKILAVRAFKAEKSASLESQPGLRTAEKRIRLPLSVFPKSALDDESRAALEAMKEFSGVARVVKIWRKKAEKFHEALSRHPWLEGVPVQALAIGGLKVLGLPGEAFGGMGMKLRRKWPSLAPVGYANGNVGYLPAREAFDSLNDYACYCAPRLYAVFPFAPEVESTLLRTSRALLASI